MSDNFSIDVTVKGTKEEAIEKATEVLSAEGFGVLTRIDVSDVLKAKIDVDFRPYTILGACNPVLAHKALSERPDIGLMLPCNVTVEESAPGECLVRFIDPKAMMTFGTLGESQVIQGVAEEAAERIGRAAAALS